MRKHTPGRWVVAHRGCEGKPTVVAHRAGRPSTIALIESGKREEDVANARLIAAAPDLLIALKRLSVAMSEINPNDYTPELQDADAAIAKAEGRT